MFVFTTVLYKNMKSPRNDVYNLWSNVHVCEVKYIRNYIMALKDVILEFNLDYEETSVGVAVIFAENHNFVH